MAGILILGGSNCQINAILRAKQKGHTVIVSDYYENAPGKAFADYGELISTFDAEGNIETARKYNIDGVMTLGTDQPVLTAARIAEALGLPSFLDVDTARAVTNKKIMKGLFERHGIPTVKFRLLGEDFTDAHMEGMNFPVVVKPLDSQGQRGVYKLDSTSGIRSSFADVLSFSREKEILLEEYYESDEITLSGWVRQDQVHILTVTDRVTYNNYPHIGICTAHNFPSKYLSRYFEQRQQFPTSLGGGFPIEKAVSGETQSPTDVVQTPRESGARRCSLRELVPDSFRHKRLTKFEEIDDITKQIVKAFGIHNGPIYFQMLIGEDGIKVNEIACRIGGAYEDELIPLLTGVDILDMVIAGSLGGEIDFSSMEGYNLSCCNRVASTRMLFTRPGVIGFTSDMNQIIRLPGVRYGKFNFNKGHYVDEITDATRRAGYMIVEGEDPDGLRRNIQRAFNSLIICDENGQDMKMFFQDSMMINS